MTRPREAPSTLTRAQADVVERVRAGHALSPPEKSVATRLIRMAVLARPLHVVGSPPPLTPEQRKALEDEIAMMLHAHRDCLRNRGIDTSTTTFDARDGYYGEAFGVMRALVVLGYLKFDSVTEDESVNEWRSRVEQRVLDEENYGGSNECDHCVARYGKDGAGRKRQ